MLEIILPVKQVPEPGAVKIDENTGTVIRNSTESVINPLDLHAVETALRLKESVGAHITVISMGPPSAAKVLREVLALGADEAILVSDRAYGGSDTWSTGFILSEAVKYACPRFDLIICGERATDGDTGQVGCEMAAALGLPVVTWADQINMEGEKLFVRRSNEQGTEELLVTLPALAAVTKAAGNPRLPRLAGKIAARQAEIKTLTQQELALDPLSCGLKGSPTKVVKIFHPKLARNGIRVEGAAKENAERLAAFLKEREVIL